MAKKIESEANCFEVIDGLDEAVRSRLDGGEHYVAFGGIVSAALNLESTKIDYDNRQVVLAEDASFPTMRDNGKVRDLDFLVCNVLPKEKAGNIVSDVSNLVGDELEVSLFGFEKATRRKRAITAKEWVSRRTIDEEGNLFYELYPLKVQVQPESYSPWQLVLPSGNFVNMLHPGGHTLAYEMRSIGGIRTKDQAKLVNMKTKALSDERIYSDTQYGVFREWRLFADAIKTLRSRQSGNLPHAVLHLDSTSKSLEAAALKGEVMHWLESHELVVDVAQKYLQKLLKPITGAR